MFATANSQTGEERIISFFLIANSQHSSEHCYKTSRAPFATVTKKKQTIFAKVCEQNTSEMWPRKTRVEGRSGKERREGEKIEMLISHCAEGGNYVLMRSRLAKSSGKRDTRPDRRTRKRISRFSLFSSRLPTNQRTKQPTLLGSHYVLRVLLHNVIR